MDWYTVFWREMVVLKKRLFKFFAGSMVSPLLYMIAFGWGLGRGLQTNGTDYLAFVVPGIIALSAMNGSYNATGVPVNISRFYHKTWEEYLIAPITPFSLVLGKIMAGCVRGSFSSLLILALAYGMGTRLVLNLWFFVALFLTSFLFASLGLVAALIITSHEDMNQFGTFVILPMTFLCGTFFSVDKLPEWAGWLIRALPLTHASQSLRSIALGHGFPLASLLVLMLYSAVLFGWGVHIARRVE
ncbi:MAG: ABC transporter permease [Peptococcaceae bacterium]|jgi:Nod factor-specific ABC transporter NodJ protein|nr:ABC transporter permease [Peptococcaceae bacterium]MDH7524938.1 ABC transporter permease [Peptococcaceae bacterium]